MTENEQRKIEQEQKAHYTKEVQNINARKEKEAQKRNKKVIFQRAKWFLTDEITEKSKDLTDLNALLYDENIKNDIIDMVFLNLHERYSNLQDETIEDLTFYLYENYNTITNKIIIIKNKEKKELERIQKEKEQEEKERQLQEIIKAQEEKRQAEEKAMKDDKKNLWIILGIVAGVILILAMI